ncbi:MAG: hypothetical protein WBD31_08460 [Rubripirellula sp.]
MIRNRWTFTATVAFVMAARIGVLAASAYADQPNPAINEKPHPQGACLNQENQY